MREDLIRMMGDYNQIRKFLIDNQYAIPPEVYHYAAEIRDASLDAIIQMMSEDFIQHEAGEDGSTNEIGN